jgi:hypothetical protein
VSLWASLKTWVTRTGVPFLVFALTILGTALGSKWNNGAFVVVGVAGVAVSATWLGRVVGVERNRTDLAGYQVARARLLFSTVLIVLAVVAVKFASEVVSFTAVGLAIFSAAAFLSEMRQVQVLRRYAAPVLLGAGFIVAAVALVALRPGHSLVKLLLVGAVLAELGTELISEDWLRRALPSWYPPRTLVVGLAIMVVAAGLMVAGGTVWVAAAMIVGVVAVAVLMASSDTASLMLILIGVAALLWANSS